MSRAGETIGYSFVERRRVVAGKGGLRVRRIGWAELGKRLARGEVLWDLRPVHEHLRFRLEGAVNLGHLDWLLASPHEGRLLDPTVIARVLARCGIVRGTAVILQAGDHREPIDLALRALHAIGIHRVTCLDATRRLDASRYDSAFDAIATSAALGGRLH